MSQRPEPVDAMDQFLQDRELLPDRCPSWCSDPHRQALEEGCSLAEASEHYGPDLEVSIRPIAGFGGTVVRPSNGSVRAQLREQHLHGAHLPALIYVEAQIWKGDTANSLKGAEVPLTSHEARTLARQLVHLADLVDLER